ncbi:hypothetical protein [Streptomyces brasiliensis]|uniref:SsuA/THI5-like domain-containing protein n=1 Tax=Streptomyces brasiliensis TaxID=1954 RepID=A0A917K0X5_9ACTN|nr:hypothetical protein [Streptomyces brasiliensis]GGI95376.1 hypothetical protein GCM10010121_002350 [Streptomyces brasiliensis]
MHPSRRKLVVEDLRLGHWSRRSGSFSLACEVMDFTGLPAAANAYTVKSDYLDVNRKAVTAFVKSEAECLALLHNDKAAALQSIMKHSGVSSPALAEYSYDFFDPMWAKTPRVDPALVHDAFAATVAKGIGTMPKDTGAFIDNSYVDRLQKSGFIDSLYRTGGE